VGFLHRGGHSFRAVIANQFEQLAHLACQGTIRAGKFPQIRLSNGAKQPHEPLLCGGALRGGHLRIQFFLESLGAEGLTTFPTSCIADDLVCLLVDRHGRRIGFDREFMAHIAWRTQ